MPPKKKIKSINPKHESLTVEKLRELTGITFSDDEAEEIVLSIKKFVRILYETIKRQEQSDENKSKQDCKDQH